jgi:hypothetical protein
MARRTSLAEAATDTRGYGARPRASTKGIGRDRATRCAEDPVRPRRRWFRGIGARFGLRPGQQKGALVRQKVMERIHGLLRELVESDEAHLAHELRSWAESIPGAVPIAEAPLRQRVRLAGEVRKLTIRPGEPFDELEATLYDGSGEVRIVWLDRRSIPGLTLGVRLVVEGVIGATQGERRMIDPAYEFASVPGA